MWRNHTVLCFSGSQCGLGLGSHLVDQVKDPSGEVTGISFPNFPVSIPETPHLSRHYLMSAALCHAHMGTHVPTLEGTGTFNPVPGLLLVSICSSWWIPGSQGGQAFEFPSFMGL